MFTLEGGQCSTLRSGCHTSISLLVLHVLSIFLVVISPATFREGHKVCFLFGRSRDLIEVLRGLPQSLKENVGMTPYTEP
jgi:hypothetical protein